MTPELHFNLPNIKHVATKVHVILRRFVVLTWMYDNRDLVECVKLGESHKVKIAIMTLMTMMTT